MRRIWRRKFQKLALILVAAFSMYFTFIILDKYWSYVRDFEVLSNGTGLFVNTSYGFEDFQEREEVMTEDDQEWSSKVNESIKILVNNADHGLENAVRNNEANNISSTNNQYHNNSIIRDENQLGEKQMVNTNEVELPRKSTENPKESTENVRESTENPQESTEILRETTEIPLESTENPRESSENPRESSENARESSENARESSENPRESSENARESTENPRERAEIPLESTENPQETTENPRESYENPRESYEIPKTRGLQIHVWRGVALYNIKGLCNHPLFPKGPSERSIITKLEVQRNENYYAQQIFGYLHPSISGLYTFAVASDDNSEVWLRQQGSNKDAIKICSVEKKGEDLAWSSPGEFDKYPSQKSKPMHLEKGKKYYIEVLHIQIGADDFVQVAWLQPAAKNFTVIDSNSTTIIDESWNTTRIGNSLFRSEACKGITSYHHHLRTGRIAIIDTPKYITHEEVEAALPVCPYRPEYVNRAGPLPEGQWYFIRAYRVTTYIYPWIVHPRVFIMPTYDDYPLEYKEADSIVREYMNNTEKKYPGVYKLNDIIKVEKKHDKDKGARYLVELNVTKNSNNSTRVISEYIYKNFTSKTLCFPENLQWQRQANIAIIISLRNQVNWMRHFLDNLEEIYVGTGEKNVSLVVFDYESNDIDLDEEIRTRRLPPHVIIKQSGKYSRCESINAAVRTVQDPHTIVFTLDLHLEIPHTIFDEVRKHCFEGRSVYTPVIVRLRPGHSPVDTYGYWEQQGYGLIAMYKSDWDRIGGLDEEKFKNKWGGEDWEMMERVVGAGMEYERVREFKMFHYYHSKKGMWTGDEDIQKEKDPFST